jgi:putative transposase
MEHRTIEVAWSPYSPKLWETFTASRLEAAHLWSDLVRRHQRLRRLRWQWPSKGRWYKWAARRYPLLHSHSVQLIIEEFLEAVAATVRLRKNGHPGARYPWRTPRYHDVPYSNQGVRIRKGKVYLPNGKSGALLIKLPKRVALPGHLVEARLLYGRLLLICQVQTVSALARTEVGVDLGVNTLLAATNGETALLISGREVKATVQWRDKCLASLRSAQSSKMKHSRRYTRLQRRKYLMLNKSRNRIIDLNHKATAKVAKEFSRALIYVGIPFNNAARKMGRKQAQQVYQACNRKLIRQLDYKTSGANVVPEPYSSQTCPVCGCRQKCRRIYKCQSCGFTAPRDVVGSLNILSIGKCGKMQPQADLKVPKIMWVHPSKYPGHKPGSSGGTPASSSGIKSP